MIKIKPSPARFFPRKKPTTQASPPTPPAGRIEVLFVSTEDPAENGRVIWAFTEMRLTYPTAVTLGGGEWEIAGAPAGIVQAGEIVVPEMGEISEP